MGIALVAAMAAMAVTTAELADDEVRCLLKGNPRRIFSAPVSEGCAGRLAILEPRDVVAGITGEFVDGFLADV